MVTTDVDIPKWQRFDIVLVAPSMSKEKPDCDVKLVLGKAARKGLRCDPWRGVLCPSMKPGTAAQFSGIFCALPSLE